MNDEYLLPFQRLEAQIRDAELRDQATRARPQRVVVTRMSDGSTVAAARIDSTAYECVFSGFGTDAPLLFTVFQEDAGLFFGRATLDGSSPVAWQRQWVRNGPSAFVSRYMFEDGHGVASNGGTVVWLPSLDAPSFKVLDNTISPVDTTSGRGQLLVWNKNDNQHGWLVSAVGPGGAVSTLLAEPAGTWINGARVTDDRVVWLSVAGPQATQFSYASARFDWMTYTVTAGQLATQAMPAGPTIPAVTGLADLAAGSDYAAAIGCDGNPSQEQRVCRVYVDQLSTGKVWAVLQRPGGNSFRKVLAVSASEAFLAEQDVGTPAIQVDFKRIVRLALGHLDEVVAAWAQ